MTTNHTPGPDSRCQPGYVSAGYGSNGWYATIWNADLIDGRWQNEVCAAHVQGFKTREEAENAAIAAAKGE